MTLKPLEMAVTPFASARASGESDDAIVVQPHANRFSVISEELKVHHMLSINSYPQKQVQWEVPVGSMVL